MYCQVYFVLGVCAVLGKIVPQNEQLGPLILTPYIESGETEKAKHLSAVEASKFAGVNSHAAYFTVNKTNKWHLFFWYFPVEGVPLDTTPLVVWLQGGPGGSSLYGLFEEIGPIRIKNGTVERRPITWSESYSLLFIDNPVGAGFSFTEDPDKYVTNEDQVGACLLSFIQQFLQVFPELRKAPLFIAGESYAGKYIPAFGHYIHHFQNESMPINLKGLAIGDGWTDPPTLIHYSELALQLGLVDPEQAEEIHRHEEEARQHWAESDTVAGEKSFNKAWRLLDKYVPVNVYNYLQERGRLNFTELELFLNKEDIQAVVHVKRMQYKARNHNVKLHLMHDMLQTVKPWLEELLEHYGVMCYNGQLDFIVGYPLSVNTYRSLQWSGRQDYLNAKRRVLYDETGTRVHSFVKASGNFIDVMVRSAGHMVPADQPRAAKQIIDMFINTFK